MIRFSKDAKDASNPFSSPAVRVNGGGTTSKFFSEYFIGTYLIIEAQNIKKIDDIHQIITEGGN